MKNKKHKKSTKKESKINYFKTVNNHYHTHLPKSEKKHRLISNAYIDNKGDYKEKPHFANFWKHGFLNDIPTRKDYNREMDGIKYTDSLYLRSYYDNEQDWKNDIMAEEHDHLYGLERFQLSLMRLLNGAPREWLKLLSRILILFGTLGLLRLIIPFLNIQFF